MVYNASGLYPHKAQISNEFNSSAVSNKGILACHGHSFEETPDPFDMHPFTDRARSLGTGITFSLHRRLAIDLFACTKLLLPNTKFVATKHQIFANLLIIYIIFAQCKIFLKKFCHTCLDNQ